MEVRRRSNRGPGPRGDDSGSPVKRSRTKSQSVDSGFTTVIAVAFVVVLGGAAVFLFAPGVKEAVFARFGLVERQHAVVIDAGSTGSRVLGFKFHRDGSGALQLDDELWVQDKPGLSSYADSPSGAAESISRLLAEAKSFIPESGWAQTPLTLRATAGLRLLPKDQSDAIIGEVEKVLRSSGFRPEDPLIEIMNPMEEGLFAWFTVNFLLDQFSKPAVDSYVTLDLGGGSTQIVFVPGARVEDLEGRRHYMHDVSVMKSTVAMYSHSYLGLGLMTARKAMFKISDDVSRVSSVCVSSKAPLTFKFQNKEFTIERNEKASADGCLELALAAVEAEGVHAPAELAGRNISGFSYFYDTPAERGMVKEVVGGVVRVGDYRAEARKACAEADSGFYCADLSFMYAMLSRGYGLSDAKEIRLFKKIDGHEVSWALGCAYNILEG